MDTPEACPICHVAPTLTEHGRWELLHDPLTHEAVYRATLAQHPPVELPRDPFDEEDAT